jgi:formamidopyrimidine-DNA glycosylase
MPELPEVENFRRLLLPLVSKTDPVHLERLTLEKKPPRKFLSDEDIQRINQQKYLVQDVLRRGKLICMVLESESSSNDNTQCYLYVHMGMTGRISTMDYVPNLQELKKDADYPPPHTYLKFSSGDQEACFSDPRKFGSILLATSRDEFDRLAPDAWTEVTDTNRNQLVEKLSNQSMGIKPLLLDQKRVVSGVGNWIADEVLYQTKLHPDQNYLTSEQADALLTTLQHYILQTAVDCLEARRDFPKGWLFNYRWNKKKNTKDAEGRTVTFVTSGGRTSAVVPSIQKKTTTKKRAKSKDVVEKSTTKKAKTTKSTTTKPKADAAVSSSSSSQQDDVVEKKSKVVAQQESADAPVEKSAKVKEETISNKDSSGPTATKKPGKGGKKKAAPLAQSSQSTRRRSLRMSSAS